MSLRLAITPGDPAGIGPEVMKKACAEPIDGVEFVLLESDDTGLGPIDRACDLALNGEVAGIVTAPVSKQKIADSGVPFIGHTEYLANRAGVKRPVMMFAGDKFRVSLVTTHLPLMKIVMALTPESVSHTIRETSKALRTWFGVAEPRIAVAGLNPHAGEGGHFGREESEIIEPGMQLSETKCEGPFAADTIFNRKGYDGFVAMYHDQALPVVKTMDPLSVNVTLGLPFIRTSPDHGTAYDIAGQDKADPVPMRRAIELAARMARATGSLL